MWCEGGGRGGHSPGRLKLTSVDEDIVASELEEGRDVLEHKGEAVRLPVVGVFGELDSSLDIY